jgi:two-component system chemotaxis response regulator CheB
VQHRHPRGDVVGRLLAGQTHLVAVEARQGELPLPGRMYVLPPGKQALIGSDRRFAFEPAGRCHADPLLKSASLAHGERLIAVVLTTGRLDDGALGVRAVKAGGDRVIVQDRETSAAFGMPSAAIATGCSDFVLPLRHVAPVLVSLVMVSGAADLFAVRPSPSAAMAS